MKYAFLLILVTILSFLNLGSVDARRKQQKGPGGMGGMGGMCGGMNSGPFGNKKMQMVFITVREGYLNSKGIDAMAK